MLAVSLSATFAIRAPLDAQVRPIYDLGAFGLTRLLARLQTTASALHTLGVIRTEELLQARRLDGGEQFFTRTFDYGFSKTRTEAAAKWNEREVLGDMVRVIRIFRPLVIYTRWQGTPADGHGQHQLAGHLSPQDVESLRQQVRIEPFPMKFF